MAEVTLCPGVGVVRQELPNFGSMVGDWFVLTELVDYHAPPITIVQ